MLCTGGTGCAAQSRSTAQYGGAATREQEGTGARAQQDRRAGAGYDRTAESGGGCRVGEASKAAWESRTVAVCAGRGAAQPFVGAALGFSRGRLAAGDWSAGLHVGLVGR